MNILYIEDNANDVHLLQRYIDTTAHKLTVASNLQEAWAALAQKTDLILIDVLINNERLGIDFARQLRKQRYMQPMIALTALTGPQDMDVCRRAGFDEIVTKPFAINQIESLLQRHSS